jgi:Ser/Thr protein kinase RdoA (MazF antagonist)
MKPYSQLTRLGKIRRLRQVAVRAMDHYALDVEWVRFFVTHTNTLFRVRTTAGETYVLRVYTEEDTSLNDNRVEIFWLNRLINDTDLEVSTPIARRDGEYITHVQVPGIPVEKRCVLYAWIPGRPLADFLNPENYAKLGQAMARMHEHAISLNPLPDDLRPKAWDTCFYYPDEPIVYDQPEYAHLFTPERMKLVKAVIARADSVFEQLFRQRNQAILLHGDLHYWNVHYHRDSLYLIDFEDVTLGYPIQDIAISFYYGRHREAYPALRAAFKLGYQQVRPWPEQDEAVIQTLIAARGVGFLNYVAWSDDEPEALTEQICERLRQFLIDFP